jgi:biotin synthase
VTAAAERTGTESVTDPIAAAREQVLERGVGLGEEQVLEILRLPDKKFGFLG